VLINYGQQNLLTAEWFSFTLEPNLVCITLNRMLTKIPDAHGNDLPTGLT